VMIFFDLQIFFSLRLVNILFPNFLCSHGVPQVCNLYAASYNFNSICCVLCATCFSIG
jgi:hypothetical protein